MKRIHYLIVFIVAAILILQSCEKEIIFSGEETEPVFVMNALFTPDSILKIHLSESAFFLQDDMGFNILKNAEVNIQVNGGLTQKLSFGADDHYVSTVKGRAGDNIVIEAFHPKYGLVESSCQLVEGVPSDALFVSDVRKDSHSYTSCDGTLTSTGYYECEREYTQITTLFWGQVHITFTDPGNVTNYYRLALYNRYYYDDGTVIAEKLGFDSEDPVFGDVSDPLEITTPYAAYGEFTDELFNGQTYTLTVNSLIFRFDEKIYSDGGEPLDGTEKNLVKVELCADLQSISASYYLYLKSRSLSESIEFGGLFSEPVQVYSNVTGGTGIVGSYVSSVRAIDSKAIITED